MPLANFPNGITSFGGLVGPSHYAGWWDTKAWYVDDDNGLDGRTGRSPARSVKTIQKAIDLAGPQDTIFLKPRDIAVGAYHTHGYYTGSLIIDNALQGLKLIGTGSGGVRGWGSNIQCAIEPDPGSTAATILVQSPGVSIENVMVKAISGSVGGGIGVDNASANEVYGLTISNCGFKDFIGMDRYGSIDVDSSHWLTVQHCIFREGGCGIVLGSALQTIRSPIIRDCDFWGAPSTWNADILIGDVANLIIDGCRFMHAVPTGGSASPLNRYVYMVGGTGTGIISNCNISAGSENIASNFTLVGTVLLSNTYGSQEVIDT